MTSMIVDANSLFARSWYAAESMGADPPEAISLMVRSLLILLNPEITKIGALFDGMLFGWDSHQNPLKNRDEKPQEYRDTKSVAKDILEYLFGAANYEHPDYEGDDIVATAVFAAKPDDIVYVVSADKDLQQLQGPNVHYYCLNTKSLLSRKFITTKWYVKRPSQVALALAILGDPVDKIKGIHGYGPVKCRHLFEAVTPQMSFREALDTLVEQIPQGKQGEFFAALDRTLLKTDVPGVPRPAQLKFAPPKEARRLGIPNISGLYGQVYDAYDLTGK